MDSPVPPGLKPKDLCGIPWRVAFALQADGWYLRNDIIWHKPNPMPESVTDRCTKSHEYLFLLSKKQRYFYDAEAVREPPRPHNKAAQRKPQWFPKCGPDRIHGTKEQNITQYDVVKGANRRTVWTIPTRGYSGAHFATFPPALVAPCILAGTSAKGVCPECGAQWERVVDKSRTFESGSGKAGNLPEGKNGTGMQGGGETLDIRRGPCLHTTTVGWRPTCEHYPRVDEWLDIPSRSPDEPMQDYEERCAAIATLRRELLNEWLDLDLVVVPSIVGDIFCGSGTVGEVCNDTQRKFAGLDLSSSYLRELALPRSENQCTMESIQELPMFAQEDGR